MEVEFIICPLLECEHHRKSEKHFTEAVHPTFRLNFEAPLRQYIGALEKPVIGEEESSKAIEPVMPKRKNVKHDPNKPDRIVADPSGDMAYEYGTTHVSFDDSDNGKQRDFTAAYLRVWKADDGSCKVAATIYQPEERSQSPSGGALHQDRSIPPAVPTDSMIPRAGNLYKTTRQGGK